MPSPVIGPGPGDHREADRGSSGPALCGGDGAVQHTATSCEQDPKGRAGKGQPASAAAWREAELSVGGQRSDGGLGSGNLLHREPGTSHGAPAVRQGGSSPLGTRGAQGRGCQSGRQPWASTESLKSKEGQKVRCVGCSIFLCMTTDGSPGKNREAHWFPHVSCSWRVCLKSSPGPHPQVAGIIHLWWGPGTTQAYCRWAWSHCMLDAI